MKTVTVDEDQRIYLPGAKPHTTFAYEDRGNGAIVLTPIGTTAASA